MYCHRARFHGLFSLLFFLKRTLSLLIFDFISFVITLQRLSETRFSFLVIVDYDNGYDSNLLTSPAYLPGL